MSNWAVIATGGKQHKVLPGEIIKIEKVNSAQNGKIVFDQVLLVASEGELKIGKPFVEKAKVTATVVNQLRAKKIRVVKFKSKSRYLKTSGHRQPYTEVRIEKIAL